MNKIRKILVIGLDAAVPKGLYDYTVAGELPTLKRLLMEFMQRTV